MDIAKIVIEIIKGIHEVRKIDCEQKIRSLERIINHLNREIEYLNFMRRNDLKKRDEFRVVHAGEKKGYRK